MILGIKAREEKRMSQARFPPLTPIESIQAERASISDENLATHVGHIWTGEMEFGNFIWENPVFCGTDKE
jgi:hypothetical protein